MASIAIGVGALAPDAETFRVRSDVSQAGRIDGLPLGTRGGMGFRYTFPQDGEYEFKIEVTQTQPPDPHQLEFSIDGEPVRLITLVRVASDNANRFGDAALTKNADLTFRVPVKAGPRTIVATFFTKPSLVSGGLREPGARFRRRPRDFERPCRRAVRRERRDRHAKPGAYFRAIQQWRATSVDVPPRS